VSFRPRPRPRSSNRTLRVNELVQRELSDILRRRYQAESVTMTITEVRVSPDLRDARVFVSIVGTAEQAEAGLRWLRSQAPAIREEISRRIVLEYLPRFDIRARPLGGPQCAHPPGDGRNRASA
jgi:ribosome-binding factor A